MNEVILTYAGHFKFSALRIPAGQGLTYLGTCPGTYPTRANIPAQHWCTPLITGTMEGTGRFTGTGPGMKGPTRPA